MAILRRARVDHGASLSALPNVVGTALGVKTTGGQVTGERSVVVFVDQKVAANDLSRRARIPRHLNVGGRRVSTDVVQFGKVEPQFGPAPLFCFDGRSQGTLSAFARSQNVALGVSCAHCLTGRDQDPNTITSISIWDEGARANVQAGQSVTGVHGAGFGVPGNFGFNDAGLFVLEHPELRRRVTQAQSLSIWSTPRPGTALAGSTAHGEINGVIFAVEAVVHSFRTDILVKINERGTFPGDSGMMWRTANGFAVGIHGYGSGNFADGSSQFSLAMLAQRAALQLNVELLELL